jgi:hypothetical protein
MRIRIKEKKSKKKKKKEKQVGPGRAPESPGDPAVFIGKETNLQAQRNPWRAAASSFHFLLQTGYETIYCPFLALAVGLHCPSISLLWAL